ncbi:MAG TPA: hypothetical protein VJ184_14665 [Chryseolinea sp.]|nr:hypothetical protein [Chryseolinea sp.]
MNTLTTVLSDVVNFGEGPHLSMITASKKVASFIIDSALSVTVEMELSSESNSNDCLADIKQ